MTAKQLEHLAELSSLAEDFYRKVNPTAARRFGAAAATATRLGAELARAEERAGLEHEATQLHAEILATTVV